MPYKKRISRTKTNRDPDSYFKINNELKPLIKRARDINAPASAAQIFDSNRTLELSKRSGAYLKSSFYRDFTLCPELNPMGNSRISFSRGSGATKIGPTGLVEFGPENLLIRSEEFDLAWAGVGTTIVTNSGVAPNGTLSAELVREDSANSPHNINFASANLPIGTITISVYAKAQGRDFLQFFVAGAATTTYVNFNLSNGTIPFSSVVSSRIIALPNGWYRCIATFNMAAVTGIWFSLAATGTQGRNAAYQGNGTGAILLWGAQAERFSSAREYIPTSGSIVYGPRFDYDPITRGSKGLLLEESRANLLVRSEEFDNASWTKSAVTISQNSITAPDGALTADSLTATSSGSNIRFVVQSVSKAASAIQYAYSFWCKTIAGGRYITFSVDNGSGAGFSGGIDIATGAVTGGTVGAGGAFTSVTAIQHINGWWRVSLVGTSTADTTVRVAINLAASLTTGYPSANLNAGDGIYVWGAQLEAGSSISSYIPTTGGSITRSADTTTIAATNFPQAVRQSEGAFFVECSYPYSVNTDSFILQSTEDGNDYLALRKNSVPNLLFVQRNNGSNGDVSGLGVTPQINVPLKFIGAYKGSDSAACANGGTVGVSSALTEMPTTVSFSIGGFGGSAGGIIHIRKIIIYTSRLTNTILQTLTS